MRVRLKDDLKPNEFSRNYNGRLKQEDDKIPENLSEVIEDLKT